MESKLLKRSYPLIFLMPVAIIYFVFFIIPFIMSTYYSFTDWNIFTASFVGITNYVNMIADSNLNIALKNTFIFAIITTTLKVGFGLLLALLLNRQMKTRDFLRTVFFLPNIINNVAIGIVFVAILHPTMGIVNKTLDFIGAGFLAQEWLVNTKLAIYSVSMVEVWKSSGFCMIIFLAALQVIPTDYYESANIDGANGWQKFIHITFPLILNAFNNVLVLCLIGGMRVFDIILATTGGGPGRATQVLNTIIYQTYSSGYYGEACAGNTMLALIIAVITLIVYQTIRKKEVEI